MIVYGVDLGVWLETCIDCLGVWLKAWLGECCDCLGVWLKAWLVTCIDCLGVCSDCLRGGFRGVARNVY